MMDHPADHYPLRSPDLVDPSTVPLDAFVAEFRRARMKIAVFTAVLCSLAVVYAFVRPPRFVSIAQFSLQAPDSKRFGGLAAQVGLALPGMDGQQSPSYYAELLESRALLEQLATSTFSDSGKGRLATTTLPQVYDISERTAAITTDEVIRRLRKDINISKSRESGIVTVSMSAPSALLSQQLLQRLLQLMADFNVKTRQSQASNERKFAEQRIAQIRVDLRTAEDRLQEFLQGNRADVSSVPDLLFQRERLQREVTLRQQLYTSLMQGYEQARMDEVRDTPAITIVQSPNLPARRESRGTVRLLALALLSSLFLSGFAIAARMLLQRRNTA